MEPKRLFNAELVVVNVGLESFGEGAREQDAKVLQVSWRPPADREVRELLDKVL